jgi:hypothetical protein
VSGRILARSVAVRDQLLAILRESDEPLPTPKILVRMANEGRNCNGPRRRACDRWPCRAWCWSTPGPLGPPLYQQLCALEKLGLIKRVQYPNAESIAKAVAAGNVYDHVMSAWPRCVYWGYVDTETDTYFNGVLNESG